MRNTVVRKLFVAAIIIPSMAFSVFVGPGPLSVIAQVPPEVCDTVTLVSGEGTETAGYTTTDPVSAPGSLDASMYSGGSFSGATATETVIPPWIDPATDPDFSGSGALWVSTDASWPGGVGNDEGAPSDDQWRLLRDSFVLPDGAVITSANIWFSADNAAEVYLNGSSIATTDDVYGAAGSNLNFQEVFDASFAPVADEENTLDFVVRNWGADSDTNPTGLLYKAEIDYCVPGEPAEPETVTVTIVKYVDGEMATAESADNNAFLMDVAWNAENIGEGSGQFNLNAEGFNSGGAAYTAVTAEMTSGADYSVQESLGTELVGPNCAADKPYALDGYTSGNTIEAASAGELASEHPDFENITSDKFVIVWNDDCATEEDDTSTSTIQVHIRKYLDGELATASSSNNYQFPMTATWQADNLNGGATTTGSFVLGNSHGGADEQYGADTAEMQAPAHYTTSEVTTGTSTLVLPVGATCEEGKYRLEGYRTSSESFGDAESSGLSTSSPVFTDLEDDMYVIVENITCEDPGNSTSTENGLLQVTAIDTIKSTSTSDGTFAGGWKYLFHITDPVNEPNLAMKFSNWLHSSGTGTIAVADNMRISSEQANNGGATIVLTAADTYSSPPLVMVTDLDAGTAGRQVQVLVEVRIPVDTADGSYTTTYGVQSLP